MASKHLFMIVLGLMSFVGSSTAETRIHGGLGLKESSADPAVPGCVTKLIPCKQYLHTPEKLPDHCCLQLKEMVSGDQKCLCGIFNNLGLLKSFNLTQEEVLKLPKSCGAKVDISICKKFDAYSPSNSPATPSIPNHAPSDFGRSRFATFLMALIISFAAAF